MGRRFRLLDGESTDWLSVIGVVTDFKNEDIDNKLQAERLICLPLRGVAQHGADDPHPRRPVQVVAGARREIRASDPDLPVFDVYTLEQVRQQGFWEYRFLGGMFIVFGCIALFLAAIGVYGVLSYSVSSAGAGDRRAGRPGRPGGDVVGLVLRQGMLLAALRHHLRLAARVRRLAGREERPLQRQPQRPRELRS